MQSAPSRVLARTSAPGPAGARPLGGRYEIINELGRGGMGTVYRAVDRLTGRVVTLKHLRPDPSLGGGTLGEARVALAAEFRVLASLRHPNTMRSAARPTARARAEHEGAGRHDTHRMGRDTTHRLSPHA